MLISTGNPDYNFGPDIIASGVVVLAWVGATVILLSPPSSALARYYGRRSLTGVVWSLGSRLRIWNVFAVPIGGVLLGFLMAPPIEVWTEATSDLSYRLIVTALFALAIAVITLFLVRLGICGVELTPTTLIARGFLFTRRYRRETIENVWSTEIGGLADFGLTLLFNSGGFFTLKIRLNNGRMRVLYASNSSPADIDHGLKVVRAWLARDVPGPGAPDAAHQTR